MSRGIASGSRATFGCCSGLSHGDTVDSVDRGFAPGELVARRYELEALIGKGGIAEVWRARHVALKSLVAIKFLQGTSAQSESMRRRFTTEAQITAQLKSHYAVQVFDFGFTEDDRPFLVMELLEGETLGRRLERLGQLGVLDTARLLGQAARALHRAHQIGIVHRDFKPDNIIIVADDEGRDYAKVVDFGIAKLVGDLDAAAATGDEAPKSVGSPSFTKTGAVLGTPFYMAPEQVRSAPDVDLRGDVWAFGVVAFECVTGCPPFTGKNLLELFDRIRTSTHARPTDIDPSVPEPFNAWFDKACAPEPGDRFTDAVAAWKALEVALGVGSVELDGATEHRSVDPPQMPRGAPPSARDIANAATLDADPKRGVEGRHRSGDEDRLFRRLTFAPTRDTRRMPGVSEAAVSNTIGGEPRRRAEEVTADAALKTKGTRRGAWALAALASVAAVVGWRVSVMSSPRTSSANLASAQPSAAPLPPSPSATSGPSASTPVLAASVSPASDAAASGVAAPRPPATPKRRAPAAEPAPASASAGAPSATAPRPAPTPSATTQRPPPDPGSYR